MAIKFAFTIVVLSYICVIAPAFSQTTRVETHPAQVEKRSDKSHPLFLWKAKRKDQTVYLLGTIHVAKPAFYPLPQEMETAARASKVLFVEADVLQADKSKMMESLKQQGEYHPPETLSKSLSPQARAILDAYLNWSGESIGMYDSWRPWVVAEMITTSALRRAGLRPDLGIDLHLLKEAHAAKKKIVSLESVDSQLKMMQSFDKSTQEKMLAATVLSMKDMTNELNKIADAWCRGDLNEMQTLIVTTVGASAEQNEAKNKLLDARNRSMADSLEKSLPPSGVSMVAVGAAHFAGKNGLLEILKQKGFEINQIYTGQSDQNKEANSCSGKNLQGLFNSDDRLRALQHNTPHSSSVGSGWTDSTGLTRTIPGSGSPDSTELTRTTPESLQADIRARPQEVQRKIQQTFDQVQQKLQNY